MFFSKTQDFRTTPCHAYSLWKCLVASCYLLPYYLFMGLLSVHLEYVKKRGGGGLFQVTHSVALHDSIVPQFGNCLSKPKIPFEPIMDKHFFFWFCFFSYGLDIINFILGFEVSLLPCAPTILSKLSTYFRLITSDIFSPSKWIHTFLVSFWIRTPFREMFCLYWKKK